MSLPQELLYLRTGGVKAGKDGEYGLLALQYLLVKHIVGLIKLHQTGRAENHHDGIDVVETRLAVVDGSSQLLRGAGGKDVDGVGSGGTRVELGLQLLANLLVEWGHVKASLRQGIGKHHARTAGMGHDGEILALDGRKGEDAAHGGEFLAREAPHDAGLAEEGLHGRVAACDSTGVR